MLFLLRHYEAEPDVLACCDDKDQLVDELYDIASCAADDAYWSIYQAIEHRLDEMLGTRYNDDVRFIGNNGYIRCFHKKAGTNLELEYLVNLGIDKQSFKVCVSITYFVEDEDLTTWIDVDVSVENLKPDPAYDFLFNFSGINEIIGQAADKDILPIGFESRGC